MDLNDPALRSGLVVLAVLGIVIVACLVAIVYRFAAGRRRTSRSAAPASERTNP